MTPPPDPALVPLLEHQLAELAAVLSSLECARHDLLPTPDSAWRGLAHQAYADAMQGLSAAVDRADSSLRSARALTALALRACAS